jgi:hypothetical protein
MYPSISGRTALSFKAEKMSARAIAPVLKEFFVQENQL